MKYSNNEMLRDTTLKIIRWKKSISHRRTQKIKEISKRKFQLITECEEGEERREGGREGGTVKEEVVKVWEAPLGQYNRQPLGASTS